MDMKLAIALSALLVGIALWQQDDEREDVANDLPAVVQAPASDALGPVVTAPGKRFDPEDYVQNSEFFHGTMRNDGESRQNMPGQSGPYDSEGNLILPIDLRRMN